MAINLAPLVPVKKYGLDAYRQMLLNLLPPGFIWRNLGNTFKLFLEAFAAELNRLDQAIVDLKRESVPGLSTINGLLPEWETLALLPEEMPLAADTELARQLAVHAKITQQVDFVGNTYFINYADVLGMTITISQVTTSNAFRVGEDTVGTALAPDASVFYWLITVVADPNNNLSKMIAAFRRQKPAHTAFIIGSTVYAY